jgi:NAD(P)-dependent dehydrogenase (short-subunit alcohol dehydrogenase family)
MVVGDVSQPEDARRMTDAAVEHYGRLDVLVANAGVIPLRTITEATPEDWDEVMAVDGRGMFLSCKYAVEEMLKTGGGAIVCLSSISGVAGQKSQSTYGPAKFAATGLTKHLAVEWADQGIRVNAVAPGTIRTERVQRLPQEPGGQEYIDEIERMHPMGRLGDRRRSRKRSSSSRPTRPRSSQARYSPSTAATSRADPDRDSFCGAPRPRHVALSTAWLATYSRSVLKLRPRRAELRQRERHEPRQGKDMECRRAGRLVHCSSGRNRVPGKEIPVHGDEKADRRLLRKPNGLASVHVPDEPECLPVKVTAVDR